MFAEIALAASDGLRIGFKFAGLKASPTETAQGGLQ
jgi:hypothetical protein